jgi:molecular chaperone GrpE
MTDPRAESEAATAPADPVDSTATPGQDAAANADPVGTLLREAAEYKDRFMRTLAEMENLRRRTEREVADARSYGIAKFARDVLTIADNMHRAREVISPELRQSSDASIKALIDGLDLTERELLKALESNGVRKFDPKGEKFDPHVHQAMYEVPDESVPSGTIAQVVQAGYMIGDRVLRPAMVAVTKGGPKPQPAAATANDNGAGQA